MNRQTEASQVSTYQCVSHVRRTLSVLVGWCCLSLILQAGWTAGAVLAHDVRYTSPAGSYEVEVLRVEWFDATRAQQVPAKLYYPKTGPGPFPLLLVSHGLGGSREGYAYLGRYWASAGYVSVHVQHLGSDEAVWHESPQPLLALQG